MITYFKMKRNEWKVKAVIYKAAADFIKDHKAVLELAQNLYTALKDVPTEDLRNQFVNKLAEMFQNENVR